MNREQRRAQLKGLNKQFKGFNITDGVLVIPVEGKEPVELNVNDFETVYALVNMVTDFNNITVTYAEELEKANNAGNDLDKTNIVMGVYLKVLGNFKEQMETIFGVGAVQHIFGVRTPMPAAIAEFIEDLTPVINLIGATQKLDTVTTPQTASSNTIHLADYNENRSGNV